MINTTRIVAAADHGGFELKETILKHLKAKMFEVRDLGTKTLASVDYPEYARAVVSEILAGNADMGILICGTGLGMSMAANRFAGIRAALCATEYTAKMARLHNDANILALGGRVLGDALACSIADTFLATDFEGGRHLKRVKMIEQ